MIAEKRDLLGEELTYRQQHRSSTTIVRYLSSLSHVFTIACNEWEWITENPVRKVSKPKLPNGRIRFLSEDEIKKVLGACQARGCRDLYIKERQIKIKFIDISSKEFSPFENNNIDYNTAMSQIHVIDGKENLLVGIPAFATVYARCQLLVTSTLLRIPFIKRILKPLYTLFAKKRLWLTGRMNTNIKK